MTFLAQKPVPCGCTLYFQPFTKGTKFVTCQGSDGVWPHDVISLDRKARVACNGGQTYKVSAVPSVAYDAEPVEPEGAA